MQALLGHAHIDTTARYIHLAPAHVKAEFDAARARQRAAPERATTPSAGELLAAWQADQAATGRGTRPRRGRPGSSWVAGRSPRTGPTSRWLLG